MTRLEALRADINAEMVERTNGAVEDLVHRLQPHLDGYGVRVTGRAMMTGVQITLRDRDHRPVWMGGCSWQLVSKPEQAAWSMWVNIRNDLGARLYHGPYR